MDCSKTDMALGDHGTETDNRQQIPEQGIDGDTCSGRSKYGGTVEGNSTAEGIYYEEMTLAWSSVC